MVLFAIKIISHSDNEGKEEPTATFAACKKPHPLAEIKARQGNTKI